MQREETRFAIEIPRMGSVILTHTWDGQIRGLKEFAPQDRPNSTVVFWTFRLMVGLGFLMIALGLWGAWLRWRGNLWRSRPFLHFSLWMGPAGIIAILAGWLTTEIGRQPWVVYGLLRTEQAVSAHGELQLGITLIVFILVYFAVFGTGIGYLLRLIRIGPTLRESQHLEQEGPGKDRRPMRPLSAASEKDIEQSDLTARS
jgi:cytochrome d ubiquinol oxidase subunit I